MFADDQQMHEFIRLLAEAIRNNSGSSNSSTTVGSVNYDTTSFDKVILNLKARLELFDKYHGDLERLSKKELERRLKENEELERVQDYYKQEIENLKKTAEETIRQQKGKTNNETLTTQEEADVKREFKELLKNNKTLLNKEKDLLKVRLNNLSEEEKRAMKWGDKVVSQWQGGLINRGYTAAKGLKGGKGAGAKGGNIAMAFIEIANMIGEVTSTVSNAVTDYQLKSIDIQKESIAAEYDIKNKELKAHSKILLRNMDINSKTLTTQFANGLSVFSDGIKRTVFKNAQSVLDIGADMIKFGYEKMITEQNLAGDVNLRNVEKNVKINELEREQTQGIVNAVIGGVDAVSGGILSGVTGAIKTLTENRNKTLTATNQLTISRLQMENEWQKSVRGLLEEVIQKQTDTLATYAKIGIDFVNSMEDVGLNIDKSIKSSAALFGVAPDANYQNYMQGLTESMQIDSGKGTYYLDKTPEDIAQIQSNYVNNTGRNIQMSNTDMQKFGLMGTLWDENTLASLTGSMDYFNHSVEESVDMFYEMYQNANKAGISNKKYSEALQKNLKLAQKYTFKGGSEGLMKMALWAEKTRFNLESFGNVISNIQNGGLEGAITQSAQLQVLGGNAAMGADPLAMIYEAWSDPEALANRFYDMTKEYAQFNKDTGEVDIKGLNAMMVANIAKAQGRSAEDVRAELTQRVKNEQIDNAIGGMNIDDERKQLLYSKSHFNKKTGQWEISVNGEKKSINNLSESDWKQITPIEENIEDYVYNIWDLLRKTKGVEVYTQNKLGYDTVDNTVQESETRNTNTLKYFKDKNKELQEIIEVGSEWATKQDKKMKYLLVDNAKHFEDALEVLTPATEKLQKSINDAATYLNSFKDAVDKSTEEIIKALRPLIGNAAADAMKRATKTQAIDPNVASVKELLRTAKENELLKIPDIRKNYNDIFGRGYSSDDDWVKSLKATNPQLYKLSQSSKHSDIAKVEKIVTEAYNQLYDEGVLYNDGVLSSNGSSMLTSASNITPIHDGSVQIAKSDPKDTALFAKTGGPFDTLFNGIFAKINEISSVLPRSMEYIMPLERIFNEISHSKGTANNSKIQIEPLKIELNGKLELNNSNSQSVDIINEVKNNPILLRTLTQLISESINKTINGGRSTYTGGIVLPRFN